MSAPDRRALVDRDHAALSIRRQCALLGLARSGVYRRPAPGERQRVGAAAADQRAVHRLAIPRLAASDGTAAGGRPRRQPQAGAAAMRRTGIAALGPKPRMSIGAGAQDLSLPSPRRGDRPAEPSLGGRPYPSSRSDAASSISSWWSIRRAGRC
jgi:putative transposase